MTDEEFQELWNDSTGGLKSGEFYRKYPTKMIPMYMLGHRDMKEIVALVGTQKEFATKFCIPPKTVNGWCSGRPCPSYVRYMICKLLGLIDERLE